MNRSVLNYWIDAGLAVSFVLVFFTGLMKWPGLIKLIGVDVYRALPMRNVSFIHDWSGLIMGLLVFVHLALHWKWIVSMTKNIFRKSGKKEQETKETFE